MRRIQSKVPIITPWTSFTMSITGSTSNPTKGTVSVDKAYYKQIGDSLEITYTIIQTAAGAAGSGVYLYNLPSGYLINSARKKLYNNFKSK